MNRYATTAAATAVLALLLYAAPSQPPASAKAKGERHSCVYAVHGSAADHARKAKGGNPGKPDKKPPKGGRKGGKVCGKTFAKWTGTTISVWVDATTDAPTAALGTALDNFVNEALDEWSCYSALGDDVMFKDAANEDDADITIVWGNLGSTGILGGASTLHVGGEIIDSDVIMNSNQSAFTWIAPGTSTDANGCQNEVANGDTSTDSIDLFSVLLHEIGHALGIDHPNGACRTKDKCYPETMYSCTDAEEFMRRALNGGDKFAIQQNYGAEP